jgi:hypothetical protein
MMVSCAIDVGGALPSSATNAVHTSFLDVASIRAEPLLNGGTPMDESTKIPAAALPNITVAPGATLSEVAAASLAGAPPPGPKTSTPTCIVAVSVEVQGHSSH